MVSAESLGGLKRSCCVHGIGTETAATLVSLNSGNSCHSLEILSSFIRMEPMAGAAVSDLHAVGFSLPVWVFSCGGRL
jgi:hypothetical protein